MSLIIIISQLTISTLIGVFYACQVFFGMTKRIIFRPIEFINSLKKKRTEIPKCLYDPSLGTHGFILLEEVKLHYVANGKEGKPLMLLLHGYPEFWYSWRYQLKEFSKDYRVVAIDMRGFGESDKPSGVSNYKIETVANDVKQLIPALGYSQCTLVGHDMGALVAWMFVTEHPQMVKEMIIMNVPYPTAAAKYMRTSWRQFRKSWYIFFHQLPFFPEFVMRLFDYKAFAHVLNGKNGVTSGNMTAEDLEAYKYTYAKGGFTAPINYYRAFFRVLPPEPSKKINKPVLIIWGSPDCCLEDELAILSKDYCSNCSVKFIRNSSHFVQIHNPEEVNELMREFLNND